MINWLLGYFIIALFISVLDRYFSGEDFKKSEWINGKTFKFKLGLSLAIVNNIASQQYSSTAGWLVQIHFGLVDQHMGTYLSCYIIYMLKPYIKLNPNTL